MTYRRGAGQLAMAAAMLALTTATAAAQGSGSFKLGVVTFLSGPAAESFGVCLAVAPAAEELKKLLILMDCGTPRIFEENKFHYVFRTAAHGAMDNIALARYITKRKLKVSD